MLSPSQRKVEEGDVLGAIEEAGGSTNANDGESWFASQHPSESVSSEATAVHRIVQLTTVDGGERRISSREIAVTCGLGS